MKSIEQNIIAKEFSQSYREKIYKNTTQNNQIVEYYKRFLVEEILKKEKSPSEINVLRNRMKRIENCNRFWFTETYESSHIKVLLKTYLCKEKFCNNCNQMKKIVLQNRFVPYLEKYKKSLYHKVFTVPDCKAEKLGITIQHMSSCFKTLVSYLNGNKKVNGIDLVKYGFQGSLRSLEITYNKDLYHPHFHVAAVFKSNDNDIEQKSIKNVFSGAGNRLFSEFESIIQRIWWLLLNKKRLTHNNILCNDALLGRYSCTVDKFHEDDYKKLFGYMTKMYGKDNSFMTYQNFKALHNALFHIRQIQGYGVFYNNKAFHSESYIEQEYTLLENYLCFEEEPTNAYEPISRLAKKNDYTILKKTHLK